MDPQRRRRRLDGEKTRGWRDFGKRGRERERLLSATRLCSQAARPPEAAKFTYNFTANFSIFIPIICQAFASRSLPLSPSRDRREEEAGVMCSGVRVFGLAGGRNVPRHSCGRPACYFCVAFPSSFFFPPARYFPPFFEFVRPSSLCFPFQLVFSSFFLLLLHT